MVTQFKQQSNDVRYISEETKTIIINEFDKQNEFSVDKLKDYISELNIKFPHIVLAQSQIESGHYKSRIFKENNNIFGMKQARQRPTVSKGTENNHAYYENWKQSVQDYAMYQAKYLSRLRTENEYLSYLGQSYAEDPNYVSKIRHIINKQ
jgi:uncharacterized FlgJ-related protein